MQLKASAFQMIIVEIFQERHSCRRGDGGMGPYWIFGNKFYNSSNLKYFLILKKIKCYNYYYDMDSYLVSIITRLTLQSDVIKCKRLKRSNIDIGLGYLS